MLLNEFSLFCSAAPFLFHPLFTLSITPASHTDKQMLPRDWFHINDFCLLTPNEPLLSDWCRISRIVVWGFLLFLKEKKKERKPLIQLRVLHLDFCWWESQVNDAVGREYLPSGAAEEHNSLWPCHEGAPLQTCRQEEKVDQTHYFLPFHCLFSPGMLLSPSHSCCCCCYRSACSTQQYETALINATYFSNCSFPRVLCYTTETAFPFSRNVPICRQEPRPSRTN